MKIIYKSNNNYEKLNETSTSRLVQRFTNPSNNFAIISGERPENDRTTELKKDVRSLGLGFNELIGRWVEDGINYDEKSLLIPEISFESAFKLGQKYNQCSIIYKDDDEICEYCTTPFENYNAGDVVRKYYINPNKPLNTDMAKRIFAKQIGGPASILKKGSNNKAFNFSTLEHFELYERFFINARLGFSEEKIELSE